jgi:dipeptidyl aminopeptidase/acylaminoacyl peptidase
LKEKLMKHRTHPCPSVFRVALTLLLALAPAAARAQSRLPAAGPQQRFELTVDSIMRGPDLVGHPPTNVVWSQDSSRVYFRWKRAGEPRLKDPDWYVAGRDGTGLRKLSEAEARAGVPPAAGDLSRDRKLTVFAEEGDLFLYDHEKGARRPLTRTVEPESNPRFTRDQRRVYFTRQNNLYVLPLDGGPLEQLTDIRAAAPPAAAQAAVAQAQGEAGTRRGANQDYLRKEERALLEAVRERAEQRERLERERRERNRRRPHTLAQGQAVVSLLLAPDETFVVMTVGEQGGGRNTIVPNYVTESAYAEDLNSRTKVGDAQGRTRMALVSIETGEVRWVDHGQRVEAAPVVRQRTEMNATETALRESGAQTATQGQQAAATTQGQQTTSTGQGAQQQGAQQQGAQQQGTGQQQGQQAPPARGQQTESVGGAEARDREVQLFQLQWSDDGKRAVMLARAADNKDRWVLLLDPASAKTKVLARVHDEAWVGGPGAGVLGWLPDDRHVYFVSEADGWAHLYVVSADGGSPAPLTSGRFEVSDVRLSRDKRKFYFTSSEGSLFERHLYEMPVGGGPRLRLTSLAGNNQADVSPDEGLLAVVNSYSNRPPELFLEANRPAPPPGHNQSAPVRITESPTPEWLSHGWTDPPVVNFRARDGASVHARLYKPANFRRGGPAVVFVHGAGYLQNAHKWWSSYYREYMFHHLLMERGYLVLDLDYRGSAGYGRDWRTGIYRQMGGKDLTDHLDGVRYLVAEHGVDPRRVGIYGGSYGGFITLMAMFREPGVFAAGAALRPVTDWAHYNHPYTANILNEPQEDPEAYRRSSPIYFAEGLRGALLICHGMVDVNVHFQDSVRLAQRLIELRKENWELAVYPVEDHAFERPSSWADQYKRILKLFTEHLHLDSRGSSSAGGVNTEAAPGRRREKSRER